MLQQKEARSDLSRRNATRSLLGRAAPVSIVNGFTPRSFLFLAVLVVGQVSQANDDAPAPPPAVRNVYSFQTARLDITTDIDRPIAQPVVLRLERTLDILIQYWHRPVRQRIHVFLVDDLRSWTPAMFPSQRGFEVVRHLGGGSEATVESSTFPALVSVYARNLAGIPEHELVHAYCTATFGWCGPDWFREGMAERAHHGWHKSIVDCSKERIASLQGSKPTVESIMQQPVLATETQEWIDDEVLRCTGQDPTAKFDLSSIDHLRRHYDSSWALCHFLGHHPKYSKGFQDFACHCLRGEVCELADFVRPTSMAQLDAEFHEFLERLANGYDMAKDPAANKAKPQEAVRPTVATSKTSTGEVPRNRTNRSSPSAFEAR